MLPPRRRRPHPLASLTAAARESLSGLYQTLEERIYSDGSDPTRSWVRVESELIEAEASQDAVLPHLPPAAPQSQPDRQPEDISPTPIDYQPTATGDTDLELQVHDLEEEVKAQHTVLTELKRELATAFQPRTVVHDEPAALTVRDHIHREADDPTPTHPPATGRPARETASGFVRGKAVPDGGEDSGRDPLCGGANPTSNPNPNLNSKTPLTDSPFNAGRRREGAPNFSRDGTPSS